MKRWLKCFVLAALFVVAFPFRSPAPFVFRPGEGWTYEQPGEVGDWMRSRAKDQLQVALDFFAKKDFSTAEKAAHRVVSQWSLSDYAPEAQYLLARCHDVTGHSEKAFNDYQKLLENYSKSTNYEEVLLRQFEIANRFLDGERFKLWDLIPTFPSMEKTVVLYDRIISNGPYSSVAPHAQMNVGTAYERESRFLNDNEPYALAAKAYARAADRYHDRPDIAAEAMFKEALAYDKQARTAEYDQSTAGRAIDRFQDFMTLFPDDPRVKEAQNLITQLRFEQARGNFETAKYYESKKQWRGARIYYSEVVRRSPDSPYKEASLHRIAELDKLLEGPAK